MTVAPRARHVWDGEPGPGAVLVHLGHVLQAAGKVDEAVAAAREAVDLYDRKVATFLVERTRNLIQEWAGRSG